MTSSLPPVDGCIVVVAKCPLPGTSKTRLAPLLGEDGAAALARAMLSDVLISLSQQPVPKILLYAPGNVEGWNHMAGILQELRLFKGWKLIPMRESRDPSSLKSTDLGTKLSTALIEARAFSGTGGVVFVGMDSPELPMEEIHRALHLATDHKNAAHVCPAHDGGYGMLCVPHDAPSSIFQGVLWSHPLTAVSQIKALTDAGVRVTIGRVMHDIDEPSDVMALAERLVSKSSPPTDRLHQSSSGQTMLTGECKLTWDALVEQEIILPSGLGEYMVRKLPSSAQS
jgi:glycosyltransferase A (GT-A) superfamily protein (DUF2064 family)